VARSPVVPLGEARWLSLRRTAGETLRAALERTLREEIGGGALREGVRLPASRVLARELGVSRGVVTDAYAQLEAQGYLVVRPRAAPVVAAVAPPVPSQRKGEALPPSPRYDFTPTTPDVTLFPVRPWLSAMRHVSRSASAATFDYRDPRGEQRLRAILADYLGRTRGVSTDPDQIIIVQGTAQGVDVLLRTLKSRGASRIAVEDPSHTAQHERVRAMGMELAPQPVDEHGIIVDGLEANAVIVTPAHQFPTGVVLSGERRRELLAWSRAYGALIVEDDYDAEFRYDREPVRALQGLAPELVAQLGTVSKTLAPALRLGWIIAPDQLVDEAVRMKRLSDDFSPALDQLALAELLRSGEYDRHLRRARAVYRQRREALLDALRKHLPIPVEGIAAGLHLVLRLPPELDDLAIAAEAARVRIHVPALSSFTIGRGASGGLVLGFGRLHESAIEPAVRALAKVIRAHLSS